MIFSKVDLYAELVREQSRQKQLIDEVYDLLESSVANDEKVLQRLKDGSNDGDTFIKIDEKDSPRIFSYETIKKISIRYRLRFLDTSYFKSEYPYTAIPEIKSFERKYDVKIKSFRIMAPAEAFDLENINKDPVLFAQLSNNSFYLLHQWGRDLSWHRKILYWPMQSFKNFLLTLASVCFLFAFSIPSSTMNIFSFQSEMYLRIWLTIHTFIGLLGISLWIGISFDKTFSSLNWNSKYYNY